jgi:DNA-binding GntR family transcriptional regulator
VSDLKTHCRDCLEELGQEFREVHKWLLFKYEGPERRIYHHNRRGIEEVRKRWGDRAAKAAEIHIKRDEEELRQAVLINDQREKTVTKRKNTGVKIDGTWW